VSATHLGTLVRLDEGQILYRQGDTHDYFYLLRSGFVHTSILRENGMSLLLEILGVGAIFGEGPAFSGLPRSVTAQAVTRATVSRYLPAEVETAMQQHPALAVALLRLMGSKTHFLLRKLTRFASSDPQERVLEFLTRVARLDRMGADATEDPAVQLTHEQIGAMTALSRVSVTRTLKSLAERGLIETLSKRVVIRDRVALLAMAKAR